MPRWELYIVELQRVPRRYEVEADTEDEARLKAVAGDTVDEETGTYEPEVVHREIIRGPIKLEA